MRKGVVEDRSLDLGRNPVRVRPLRAGEAVNQAIAPIGLEIPPYFLDLLPGIAHHFAGLADIRQILGEFQQ